MKRDYKLLIRGIGIGVIVTSLLFYCVFIFSIPKETTISNEEIIIKAKDLGMIFVSDLQKNPNINNEIVTDFDSIDNNDDEVQMDIDSMNNNIDTDRTLENSID
ncbi:MAG: hypothetical protein CVV02_14110 [Firmicutes bacterium HGW-Firmicutes-7]|nr:MAG: hypothetical protein CVV02_14110 [Firmicutes bacterium HGW-Firmicutes-7]